MQDTTPPHSLGQRLLLFALLSLAGGVPVLLYFGILPWQPARYCRAIFCDPYHWQILALGIGFLATGLCFVIPPSWHLLGRLAGLTVVISMAAGIIGSLFFR